jgi:hypothetical protein
MELACILLQVPMAQTHRSPCPSLLLSNPQNTE